MAGRVVAGDGRSAARERGVGGDAARADAAARGADDAGAGGGVARVAVSAGRGVVPVEPAALDAGIAGTRAVADQRAPRRRMAARPAATRPAGVAHLAVAGVSRL